MKQTNKYVLLLLKLSQILLVIIGVYCSLMISITRFNITVNSNALLLALVIASVALFFVFKYLEQFPAGHWIGFVSLCLLYGVFTIRFFQPLKRGLLYTINCFLKVLIDYSQTKMNLLSYSKASQAFSNEYCATVLLCYVGVMLVAIISITFYRKRNVGVYLVCTLPFVALPLIVGRVGYYNHTIPYIMVTASVLATGHFKGEVKNELVRQKVSLITAATIAIVGAVAFIICPPSRYSAQTERLVNMKKSFIEIANWSGEDVLSWFKSNFSNDAIDYGKVGNKAEIKYTGKKLLEIYTTETPSQQGCYMKSYVGDQFEDGEWRSFQKSSEYRNDFVNLKQYQITPDTIPAKLISAVAKNKQTLSQDGSLIDQNPYKTYKLMHVKNIAYGSDTNIAPYYNEGGIEVRKDGKILLNKSLVYDINYYSSYMKSPDEMQDSVEKILLPKLQEIDPNYKNLQQQLEKTKLFVDKYYTQMPEDWDSNYLSDFSQKAALAEANQANHPFSLSDKVNFVRNYLQSNTTYTLAPGITPKGENPVDYFLNKNKKGYCVHYATAAVMMLRNWGVPCRYVEGVQVESNKFEKRVNQYQAEVLDWDAHAWIEVYYDKVGFVPFEVTPGSRHNEQNKKMEAQNKENAPGGAGGSGDNSWLPSDAQQQQEEEEKQKQPEVTQDPNYHYTPEESMEFEDVENAKTKDELAEQAGEAASNSVGKKIWRFVKPILIILLIAFLIQAQCVIRRRRYNAKLKKLDRSKRALAMYHHIKPLMKHKGVLYTGQTSRNYIRELAIAVELDEKVVAPYVTYLLKAYFGKEPITKEEFLEYHNSNRQIYIQMRQKQSRVFRILYQYIRNI